MPRLMWTAWTAVLLIVCVSCRTNPGMVSAQPMMAATGGSGPVCQEFGDCPECFVEILDTKDRAILYGFCGDDAPGACCPCEMSGACLCSCKPTGGDPSVLPPTEDGKYIVRVGPTAVVTIERKGKPTETHLGPVELIMEAPLPMEATCR